MADTSDATDVSVFVVLGYMDHGAVVVVAPVVTEFLVLLT